MNKAVGSLIRQVRQVKGMTQAELARQLKTSQSAVNRIEQGKQNLSLKTLAKISKVLDHQLISLNQLGQPKIERKKDSKGEKLIISLEE